MAGRKKLKFSEEIIKQIEEAALHQARDYTISESLGIDDKTFKAHFSEKCRQKRAEGKIIKLKQQFNDKSPTMLVWWGKQHLEQSDKQQLTGKDGQPLQVQVIDGYSNNNGTNPSS